MFLIHTGDELPSYFHGMMMELRSAAANMDQPVAGTALNMLDGIHRAAQYRSRTLPDLPESEFMELVMAAATNPAANLHVRLPAIQIAARHHVPGILEHVRGILSNPSPNQPIMLSQSACSAISLLGGSYELPLLQRIIMSGDPHLRPAAEAALATVNHRVSSTVH